MVQVLKGQCGVNFSWVQVHEVSTSYWLEVLGGRLLEGFCMAKPLEGARKSHTPRERERERATARTSEEGSLHFS